MTGFQSPIPNIRSHAANWAQFKKSTSVWPVLSITVYVLRFVIVIGGAVSAVQYAVRHDLTKNQGLFYLLVVLVPSIFAWLFVERAVWNHELREHGISSAGEIWGTDQFPPK